MRKTPKPKQTPQKKDLARQVQDFTDSLQRDYADEIAQHPAAFKQDVVHLIRMNLPPGPGQPCHQDVTQAVEMYRKHRPWSEIYRVCISKDLRGPELYLAQIHLRDACRTRRRRGTRTKPPRDLSRDKTPHGFVRGTKPPRDLSAGLITPPICPS
jgi:hypothetical protein